MKFMLMMNAPRGTGDWGVAKWSPDDLKAHIGFMKRFNEELQEAGELVGAEGLAMPGEARLVRATQRRRARGHRRSVRRGQGVPGRLLDRGRGEPRARLRDRRRVRPRRPGTAARR